MLTRIISIQKKRADEMSNSSKPWFRNGGDILRIWNARLVINAHIAIATAILFLFQMAILQSHHHIRALELWMK